MTKTYGSGNSVTIDHNDQFNAIIRKLDEFVDGSLHIGIFDDAKDEDGGNVATYAAAHEWGAKRIPERSFMRSTLKENEDRYYRLLLKQMDKLYIGDTTPTKIMMRMGVIMSGDIRRKITAIKEPPLAESTKRRKAQTIRSGKKHASFMGGAGNPLIDTGLMRNSIAFRIIYNNKASLAKLAA